MAIKLSKKFIGVIVVLVVLAISLLIALIVTKSANSGVVVVLDHTATTLFSRSTINETDILKRAPSLKPRDVNGRVCPDAKDSCTKNAAGPFTDLCQVMKGRTDGCFYKHPNIVHYVKFTEDHNVELTFQEFVSILSVHRFYKPDKIIIHSNLNSLHGEYWKLATNLGTKVELRKTPKTRMPGQPYWVTHRADLFKVQTLYKQGGIFMDFDVVILNGTRFRELQSISECVFGTDTDPCTRLCAGFISCVANSPFVRMWWEWYKQDYLPYLYVYNAGTVPSNILRRCTNCYDVYVDRTISNVEVHQAKSWLKPNGVNWRDKAVSHFMNHGFDIPPSRISPQALHTKLSQGSLGEMFRYILQDRFPHVLDKQVLR